MQGSGLRSVWIDAAEVIIDGKMPYVPAVQLSHHRWEDLPFQAINASRSASATIAAKQTQRCAKLASVLPVLRCRIVIATLALQSFLNLAPNVGFANFTIIKVDCLPAPIAHRLAIELQLMGDFPRSQYALPQEIEGCCLFPSS